MRLATWALVTRGVGGEALDAVGGGEVEGAPGLDEVADGDIGCGEVGVEGLLGEGACVMIQISLLAFKSAVSSDPTSSLSSWSDPCRWPGISYANISGSSSPRVVRIAVSSKNLSDYIPSELGSLLFFCRLNLHGNLLSGSIPTQLFNATSLHSLFLYDNNLTGDISPEICNLPRIQNLDLSRNSLSGEERERERGRGREREMELDG